MLTKQEKRKKRHKRIRSKIFGTKEKPRFCIFKSGKHIYAQMVDDEKGKTLVSVSDLSLKKLKDIKEIGQLIAKKSKDLKIEKVVFDRSGYKYHGNIKKLAEGAREEGLKF